MKKFIIQFLSAVFRIAFGLGIVIICAGDNGYGKESWTHDLISVGIIVVSYFVLKALGLFKPVNERRA